MCKIQTGRDPHGPFRAMTGYRNLQSEEPFRAGYKNPRRGYQNHGGHRHYSNPAVRVGGAELIKSLVVVIRTTAAIDTTPTLLFGYGLGYAHTVKPYYLIAGFYYVLSAYL